MEFPLVLIGALSALMLTRLVSVARMRPARHTHPRRRDSEPGARSLSTGRLAPVHVVRPQSTVSVVIPAINEAGSIAWVMHRIPPWVSEVVLVDGMSTDTTVAIARQIWPDLVVVSQHPRGKGAALRAGFAAATGEIIVMIDADGSTNPAEMAGFVTAVENGAGLAKGSRHVDGGGSADSTLLRRLGNLAFVKLANTFYGCEFTDLCYGYCAFRRDQLDLLRLTADGFEIETQLLLNAVTAGLRIHELPSMELARRAGTSNLSAFRDGRRVLRTIMEQRPRRRGSRPVRPAVTGATVVEMPLRASAPTVYRAVEARAESRVEAEAALAAD